MARKQIKVSRSMLITWFMLAGLILLFAPTKVTNVFQSAFARVFHWPLSVGGGIELLRAREGAEGGSEKRKLENTIANLQAELDEAHKAIEKLSGLQRSTWEGARFKLGGVVAITRTGGKNELVIDRGSKDGIRAGQFVLGDSSVIGVISEAASRTSRVKLVTDRGCRIAVKIQGVTEGGILHGTGKEGLAAIEMIKQKPSNGSVVTAIKKAGLIAAPIIVGRVVRTERNENPLLWDALVAPVCDLTQLSEVAVVVMSQ